MVGRGGMPWEQFFCSWAISSLRFCLVYFNLGQMISLIQPPGYADLGYVPSGCSLDGLDASSHSCFGRGHSFTCQPAAAWVLQTSQQQQGGRSGTDRLDMLISSHSPWAPNCILWSRISIVCWWAAAIPIAQGRLLYLPLQHGLSLL